MTRPDLEELARRIDAAVARGLDGWAALCDADREPMRCSCAAGGVATACEPGARICEPAAKVCEGFASQSTPTPPTNKDIEAVDPA